MKILNFNEFKCSSCGLPSQPGVCELCRVRVASPDPGSKTRHYSILAAIGVISVLVLIAGFVFATQN